MITLGPYKKLLLLGSGSLLTHIADWAHQCAYDVEIVTSPQHSEITKPYEKNIPIKISEPTPELGGEGTLNISVGSDWIFKSSKNLFNVHGTRFPQHRGRGGFSWQILTGNRFGFCQFHLVNESEQTGPIIAYVEFIYPPSCRTPLDYQKIYDKKAFDLISDIIESVWFESQDFAVINQPEYLSSYWPPFEESTGAWLDWSWDVHEIERIVCAFDEPYEGAKSTWQDQTIYLRKAFAHFEDGTFHPFQAGLVYRNNGRWLCVATAGGSLIVEQVLNDEGINIIPDITVGDAFVSPPDRLLPHASRLRYAPKSQK